MPACYRKPLRPSNTRSKLRPNVRYDAYSGLCRKRTEATPIGVYHGCLKQLPFGRGSMIPKYPRRFQGRVNSWEYNLAAGWQREDSSQQQHIFRSETLWGSEVLLKGCRIWRAGMCGVQTRLLTLQVPNRRFLDANNIRLTERTTISSWHEQRV